MRRLPGAAGAPVRQFPPEFAFDPASGAALQVPPDMPAPPWVPPYGAQPVSDVPPASAAEVVRFSSGVSSSLIAL